MWIGGMASHGAMRTAVQAVVVCVTAAALVAIAARPTFAARQRPKPAPRLKIVAERPALGGPLQLKVFLISRHVSLGAYTLQLSFDPSAVEVTAINGGTTTEFASAPITNQQQFVNGRVRFSAFQARRMDGPTGRVHVAEFLLQPRGSKRHVRLEILPITVTDTDGATYRVQKRVRTLHLPRR